jgi:hypothetical protein
MESGSDRLEELLISKEGEEENESNRCSEVTPSYNDFSLLESLTRGLFLATGLPK